MNNNGSFNSFHETTSHYTPFVTKVKSRSLWKPFRWKHSVKIVFTFTCSSSSVGTYFAHNFLHNLYFTPHIITAGIAQSVWRLGYGLDDRGSVIGRSNDGIFSLRHRLQTGPGVHPASCKMNTGDKAARAWSCTSTPQYVFMTRCLVKHRSNFAFIFTPRIIRVWDGQGEMRKALKTFVGKPERKTTWET
jgi:hypothetical protein